MQQVLVVLKPLSPKEVLEGDESTGELGLRSEGAQGVL